uniref:Uncharacterized protein n=1 Tax=Aegilops tauschii subsp. strangulata TaxID=200361 RepID=A0A453CL79_AEGTS
MWKPRRPHQPSRSARCTPPTRRAPPARTRRRRSASASPPPPACTWPTAPPVPPDLTPAFSSVSYRCFACLFVLICSGKSPRIML